MGNSDNRLAGIIAMVGGVIEATIIISTISDFGPYLDRSAFGFLLIPGAAVITGIYMVRAASTEADKSCLFLGAFWLLLGGNLPAFLYFLILNGAAAS